MRVISPTDRKFDPVIFNFQFSTFAVVAISVSYRATILLFMKSLKGV